jgi:hypothetical protein
MIVANIVATVARPTIYMRPSYAGFIMEFDNTNIMRSKTM